MMTAKNKLETESNGPLFHLAFPVIDLNATRAFYREVLGCGEGRSAETWIDFDFYGHQITAHLQPSEAHRAKTNAVDGDDVPVRHFGCEQATMFFLDPSGNAIEIKSFKDRGQVFAV